MQLLLILVATIWILNPVAAGLSGCDDLSGIITLEQVDFENEIQPLFNTHCTQCHGGPDPIAFMDLTAGTSQIVDVPSFQVSQLNRVEPGDPSLSYLFYKINCANQLSGDRMPRDAPPLNLFDQALIRDWIKQILIFKGQFE